MTIIIQKSSENSMFAARFEMERSQWEVEKAELQARIAFLQGERKGQENLKNDLVRRIKMLEYALKQERAKYSKLKYGGDGGDIGPPPQDEDGVELPALEQGDNMIAVTNSNWRQGRQLLRQYLQEIGYTGRFWQNFSPLNVKLISHRHHHRCTQ